MNVSFFLSVRSDLLLWATSVSSNHSVMSCPSLLSMSTIAQRGLPSEYMKVSDADAGDPAYSLSITRTGTPMAVQLGSKLKIVCTYIRFTRSSELSRSHAHLDHVVV